MARHAAKQEFVVIGLGRFGASLALKLVDLGHSVLAIDRDRALVQQLSDELTQVVALDATDEDALRGLGIEAFDTAVVAIGADFESNILITTLLKELGVRTVVCKALNQRHALILRRVGADRVVLPEHEAGVRLARQLVLSDVVDTLELEPGVSVSEVRCAPKLAGRRLGELRLNERFGITVLILKGAHLRPAPSPDEVVQPGDSMVVLGPDSGIAQLQEWGS